MSEQTTEVASAIVRFMGDLKPLEKAASGAKKILGGLGKTNFGGAISKGAMSAGKPLLSLARHGFYVKEVLGSIVSLAAKLTQAFLGPAMSYEKTILAIKGITGSAETANAMMAMLNKTAMQFGLNLQELNEQAVTLTVLSDGDVAQAEQYAKVLARINALRPDLPAQRQLGVIFALKEGDFSRASMLLDIPAEKLKALAGVAEETSAKVSSKLAAVQGALPQLTQTQIAALQVTVEDGSQVALSYFGDLSTATDDTLAHIMSAIEGMYGAADIGLGRYTSVVRAGLDKAKCGEELGDALKKGLSPTQINALMSALGASDEMMEGVAGGMLGNLERLKNGWLKFRTTVGTQVLEALAGPLADLVEWLQDNEDLLGRVGEAFGEFLAQGIEKLIAWLDDDGFAKLTEWFESLPGLIEDVMTVLGPLIDILGSIGFGVSGDRAPENIVESVAKTVIHPEESMGTANTVLKQIVGLGTGLLGMFRGQTAAVDTARNTQAGYDVAGIMGVIGSVLRGAQGGFSQWQTPAKERQQLDLYVHSEIDKNGNIKPYVEQEISRNNDEIAGGMPLLQWGYQP